MTSVIELEQLSVTFGKRPILKSLSGALDGRAIGLLGPNGAGKTSLIHAGHSAVLQESATTPSATRLHTRRIDVHKPPSFDLPFARAFPFSI